MVRAAGVRSGPGATRRDVHRLVPHGDRREPAGRIQPGRRPLVPHGDDLVHLLRGDVLCGLLRRALLCAHALGALIGGEGVKIFNKIFLWQNYDAGWPTNGPAKLGPRADGSFEVIPAFGVPGVNTLILLTSGITVTIAHDALKSGRRGVLKVFLALT